MNKIELYTIYTLMSLGVGGFILTLATGNFWFMVYAGCISIAVSIIKAIMVLVRMRRDRNALKKHADLIAFVDEKMGRFKK